MSNQETPKISKIYLFSVLGFMLIFPCISIIADNSSNQSLILLGGKWFVFWAIGIRLFTAGIKQVLKPAFTAEEIFHIQEPASQIIVRELGFANICFGLAGIMSLFIPGWRTAAAFIGGLYLGIAGVYHIIKKPSTANEVIAMVSDLFVFLVMAAYLFIFFTKP